MESPQAVSRTDKDGYFLYRPKELVVGKQRYRLLSSVSRSTWSEVFKARRSCDGEVFAIKVFRRDACDKDSADHEERVLDMLDKAQSEQNMHYVPRFIERLTHCGHPCLIMELIPGPDLCKIIHVERRKMPLDNDLLKRVAYDSFSGLAFIHENGLVHGDVKPSNIMRFAQGREKSRYGLVDFGLSQRVEELARASQRNEKIVMQTMFYRAPEVYIGMTKLVCDKADVWALACCLLELAGQRVVFGDKAFKDEHHARDVLCHIYALCGALPPSMVALIPNATRLQYFENGDRLRPLASNNCPGMVAVDKGETTLYKSIRMMCLEADPLFADLIVHCLQLDPRRRFSAAEAAAHPYFESLRMSEFNAQSSCPGPYATADGYLSTHRTLSCSAATNNAGSGSSALPTPYTYPSAFSAPTTFFPQRATVVSIPAHSPSRFAQVPATGMCDMEPMGSRSHHYSHAQMVGMVSGGGVPCTPQQMSPHDPAPINSYVQLSGPISMHQMAPRQSYMVATTHITSSAHPPAPVWVGEQSNRANSPIDVTGSSNHLSHSRTSSHHAHTHPRHLYQRSVSTASSGWEANVMESQMLLQANRQSSQHFFAPINDHRARVSTRQESASALHRQASLSNCASHTDIPPTHQQYVQPLGQYHSDSGLFSRTLPSSQSGPFDWTAMASGDGATLAQFQPLELESVRGDAMSNQHRHSASKSSRPIGSRRSSMIAASNEMRHSPRGDGRVMRSCPMGAVPRHSPLGHEWARQHVSPGRVSPRTASAAPIGGERNDRNHGDRMISTQTHPRYARNQQDMYGSPMVVYSDRYPQSAVGSSEYLPARYQQWSVGNGMGMEKRMSNGSVTSYNDLAYYAPPHAPNLLATEHGYVVAAAAAPGRWPMDSNYVFV